MSSAADDNGRLGEPALPINRYTRTRGLTLLEVMLGLALLALISGGVIAVVQSALISTRVARENFRDDQEISMLFAYFRNLFLNLPTTISIDTAAEPTGDVFQQLQFHNAPELFSWGRGREGPQDTLVLLNTKNVHDHGQILVLEKQLQHPAQNFIRKELTLLDELAFLEWSFYEPKQQKWLSTWSDRKQRPAAIRLRLQRHIDPEPQQAIFALSPAIPQKISP